MYVKQFRYKLKNNALEDWKKVMKAATAIYRKHGDNSRWEVIIRKEKGGFITVVELNFYHAKQDYKQLQALVAKDPAIQPLYKKMQLLLITLKVDEEEFELLDTSFVGK